MAQSTATRRCLGPRAVATLAATALMALTAGALARQTTPGSTKDSAAARERGEPVMAIVSIQSQQITLYDAEGWILRAPVSTGAEGRETPAGLFAVVEK
jgi:hypothetical protein